jgi:hypothetical protein
MNLKTYNATNTAGSRPHKAIMSISKNGLIRFSQGAVELMDIKAGDQVQFCQDENEPENWFIEVVKKGGFPLRDAYGTGGGLLTNASGIKRHLFQSVNYLGESGTLFIGEQVQIQKRTFYTLITGFLRNV